MHASSFPSAQGIIDIDIDIDIDTDQHRWIPLSPIVSLTVPRVPKYAGSATK